MKRERCKRKTKPAYSRLCPLFYGEGDRRKGAVTCVCERVGGLGSEATILERALGSEPSTGLLLPQQRQARLGAGKGSVLPSGARMSSGGGGPGVVERASKEISRRIHSLGFSKAGSLAKRARSQDR